MFLILIPERTVSDSGLDTDYPAGIRCFSQLFQANVDTVPQIM
jgi:hypothetical protein